jgi:hypothetical protein
MSTLPTWAIWSIVVPLVLFSPVIAFFLALAAGLVFASVWDAGAPALVPLGTGIGGLMVLRKLTGGRRRAGRHDPSD